MRITNIELPEEKYSLKCPYAMTPEGIAVHNTANDASAMAEISYMQGNSSSTSFHAAVDDYQVVTGLPFDRNGWHTGDGRYGRGNRTQLGIEICYSKSGGERFDKAERLAAKYIAFLLVQYGWGIEKVSKHQDYANKYCPHRTLDLGWERFLNLVRSELGQEINQVPNTDNTIRVVAEIQKILNERYGFNLVVDNIFGPKTKEALIKALQLELNKQCNAGLKVDGVFGNNTYSKCVAIKIGDRGNITWILQALLKLKGYDISIDGVFGNQTLSVLKQYQQDRGLKVDGIAGRNTFRSLLA